MKARYNQIEVNPSFRRAEVQITVPDWIKESTLGPEISDIVNDSEARLIIGQGSSYIARTRLTESVYLNALVKFGGIGVKLAPESGSDISLPIFCENKEIIQVLSLQVDGDRVWLYKGEPAPGLAETIRYVREANPEEEFLSPMHCFAEGLGVDFWAGELWEKLKEIDLGAYVSDGLFTSVPYSEFDRKLDLLREFCRSKNYRGFIFPLLKKHPEPDFRIP